MTKVSVIVPVYNTKKYLKKCMDSLVNQTLQDIEIICIDDGSTDGSLEMLKEYANNDSRIRILTQNHKKQGAARNYGITVAKGEYIGFCDSDDWCDLDMFEKFYLRAKETDADVTFCKIKIFNEDIQSVVQNDFWAMKSFRENLWHKNFDVNDILDLFLSKLPVSPYNKLIKREFLIENNIEFPLGLYFEDAIFSQLCTIKADKISLADIEPYYYRINSLTSTCTARDLTKFDIFKILKITKKILKENNLYEKCEWDFIKHKKEQIKHRSRDINNPLVRIIYNVIGFFDLLPLAIKDSELFISYDFFAKIRTSIWVGAYKIFENYDIDIFFKLINKLIILMDNLYLKTLRESKNPVIIIETVWSHGETIPAVYKYFKDLNLEADIILPYKHQQEKSLSCLSHFKPTIKYVNDKMLRHIFEKGVLNKYKIVFYNSFNTYTNNPNYYPNVFKAFKINNKESLVCGFLHHLDYREECDENNFKYFALTDLKNEYSNSENFVNPHYFGNILITPKNSVTNFIAVGNFESQRRNVQLLFNNVEDLLKAGYTNFKITCIGSYKNLKVPASFSPYLDFKGRLDYTKMYKEMEKADFFLPLLDSDNIEHERYITIGTSGSFQLIYGFKKPCLIHKKFAKPHFFDSENSIIYSKNEELYLAMKKAIDMNENEYSNMQENLAVLSNNLYKKSLENLKNVIGERLYD